MITGPSVSHQICEKYMKGFSLKKIQNILNNFFPNINMDLEMASRSLLSMLENWKSAVDNKKVFGALRTDLSKAFD